MPTPLPRTTRESVVKAYGEKQACSVGAIACAHEIAVSSVYRVLGSHPERVPRRRKKDRQELASVWELLRKAGRAGREAGVGLWTFASLTERIAPTLVGGEPAPAAAVARALRALGLAPDLIVRRIRAHLREDPGFRARARRDAAALRRAWLRGVHIHYIAAVPLAGAWNAATCPYPALVAIGPGAAVRFRLGCKPLSDRALLRVLQQVMTSPQRPSDRCAGLLLADASLAAAQTPLVQAYLHRRAHGRPPWRLCMP